MASFLSFTSSGVSFLPSTGSAWESPWAAPDLLPSCDCDGLSPLATAAVHVLGSLALTALGIATLRGLRP